MTESFPVLLAEDDTDHVVLFRRALGRFDGTVDLHVARDGRAALELLEGGLRPRLMFLDINMPRLSGVELLGEIQRREQLRSIPAVMLTTSARDDDRSACLERGAQAYLVKPVSFREFRDAILDILAQHRPMEP